MKCSFHKSHLISHPSTEKISIFGNKRRYVSLKILNFSFSSTLFKCHSPTIFLTFLIGAIMATIACIYLIVIIARKQKANTLD